MVTTYQIPCPNCETGCVLCDGTGIISPAVSELHQAYLHAERHDPEWNGDDASRRGFTRYTLAMWYRSDFPWAAVDRFEGAYEAQNGGWFVAYAVLCNGLRIGLHGVSWGFRGEGPRGLAAVIAASFHVDLEQVKDRVYGLPQATAWALTRESFAPAETAA